MRRIPSWGWISGIVVVAVLCGGGLGWWFSHDNNAEPASDQGKPPIAIAPTEASSAPVVSTPAQVTNQTDAPPVAVVHDGDQIDAFTGKPPVVDPNQAWETQLDNTLLADSNETEKTEKLLKLLSTVPENAQVEISQHLINFVTDDNYGGVAQLLTNATTSEAVSSVFMNDLLNRNDALKLPLLLAVARNEDHPKHTEAQNLLELFLQDNYGNDWDKWGKSVTNWLAENGGTPPSVPEPAPATPTDAPPQ